MNHYLDITRKKPPTRFNLSYTAYASPDGQWGTLRPDGTWTGVVGELQMKRADIALSGLMVTQVISELVTLTFYVPLISNSFYHRLGAA